MIKTIIKKKEREVLKQAPKAFFAFQMTIITTVKRNYLGHTIRQLSRANYERFVDILKMRLSTEAQSEKPK